MKGIVSVGMANLSRIGSRSKALKLSAQTEYYNALRFTNAALSHPTLATNDATLIAILFLSLYEVRMRGLGPVFFVSGANARKMTSSRL